MRAIVRLKYQNWLLQALLPLRAPQDEERGLRLPRELRLQPGERSVIAAACRIGLRVRLLQPACNGREIGLSLLSRYAGLEPPKDAHHPGIAIGDEPV